MLYFEDLDEGDVHWGNECFVDKSEMLDYAHKNDPLPMHINEDAAKQTPYGGLIASGGYTITLWYRSTSPITGDLSLLAGFDWHLNLPRPVRADDRLRVKITILSKRLSSKPARGLVSTRQEMLNQNDEAVLVCEGTWLVATRPT